MDDLKLIREALEAILARIDQRCDSFSFNHATAAIAALSRIEKQEPYGWVVCYQGGDPFLVCSEHDLPKDKHAAIAPIYTTPSAPKPEVSE